MLTAFPKITQIIIYKKGIEDWDIIAEGFRRKGYNINAYAFDDKTDISDFQRFLSEKYFKMIAQIL